MNSVRLICSKKYYDKRLNSAISKGSLIVEDRERAKELFLAKVCDISSIDSPLKYDSSKKTVCVYYNLIYRVGGAEVASYTLVKYLSQFYNVIFVFDGIADGIDLIYKISEYADIRALPYNIVECDTLIIASLYCYTGNLRYKKCIRWVHGCFEDIDKQRNIIKDLIRHDKSKEKRVSDYVCVGQECAKQCKSIYSKVGIETNPTVIYNIMKDGIKELSEEPVDIERRTLNLATVSRISKEKGMERVLKAARFLKDNNVDFIWYIVGDGSEKQYISMIKEQFKEIKELVFTGYKENPYPYIKNADFNVLLSDYEAYSVAVAESMFLGTPSITTDFNSAKEIVLNSGRIVKKDLSDLTLDTFKKMKVVDKVPDNREKWLEVI